MVTHMSKQSRTCLSMYFLLEFMLASTVVLHLYEVEMFSLSM